MRQGTIAILTLALALAVLAGPLQAQDTDKAREIEGKIVRIVSKISPAYVRIGGGSGVVITPDGWMLTNNHVVAQFKKRKLWDVFMPIKKTFKADLYGLDKTGEILGARLNTIHNLHYYQSLMRGLRGAIAEGRLDEFVNEFYAMRSQAVPPVA